MNLETALEQCTIENNVVILPDVQLDRKVYAGLKKKLEGIGGKWNRKAKGFVFVDRDPNELLGRVQKGEDINLKKQYQFFPTPLSVAEIMRNHFPRIYNTVLEPSAGRGHLLKVVKNAADVDICELDYANVKYIYNSRNREPILMCQDFMNYESDRKYDLVLANPPFTKGQYCDHIKKMYSFLKDEDSRVVTIAPTGFQNASVGKQKNFREWLSTVDHEIISLPEGSFKESGTMVRTCIIVLRK